MASGGSKMASVCWGIICPSWSELKKFVFQPGSLKPAPAGAHDAAPRYFQVLAIFLTPPSISAATFG